MTDMDLCDVLGALPCVVVGEGRWAFPVLEMSEGVVIALYQLDAPAEVGSKVALSQGKPVASMYVKNLKGLQVLESKLKEIRRVLEAQEKHTTKEIAL